MTATSIHAGMDWRTQAARAHRRRLWCAAVMALAIHTLIYFTSREPVITAIEFGMDEPAPSVEVELVEQRPEAAIEPPVPEPPKPEPEPPKPEPVPEPPPQPPKPDDFATPLPPKPEPKPFPKPAAKPKPSAAKPPTAARPASTGGAPAGTGVARGGRTAGPGHLYNPKPAYPAESRAAGDEGLAILRVSVDATGRPASVTLARTSGHPRLDRAAQEAVRRWRFKPATRDGIPYATSVDVPVRFSLR